MKSTSKPGVLRCEARPMAGLAVGAGIVRRGPAARLALAAAIALMVLGLRPAHAGVERHKYDLRDLAAMSDATRAEFERGEALLLAGKFADALPILQHVTSEAPISAIAFRRLTETFIALGRREDANRSCLDTLHRRGSTMDFRACVRAITLGSEPLKPEDMELAVLYARRALDLGANLPFGYAAQCDVAHRLGDVDMLNECTKQLQRIAPDHEETRRAVALVSAVNHPFATAGAWTTLVMACAGTLLHARCRRARGRHTAGAVALGSSLLCIFVCVARPAYATDAGAEAAGRPKPGHLSKFEIDDRDPLSSVPSPENIKANPLQFGYFVMDLTERAEKAAEAGDHRSELKYWQALAKANPDRSYAFAKMCATYEALNDWEGAVYSCAAALERFGATLQDYMRYVGIVLSKKGDLNSTDLAALDKVLAHLATDPAGKGTVDEFSCRIGARTWDANRLAACTAGLTAQAPNHPNTIYYQWALAVARGDSRQARSLIGRAREVPVKEEQLRYMEKETDKLGSRWINHLGITAGLLVALASAAGLFYISRRRSSQTPRNSAASGATV